MLDRVIRPIVAMIANMSERVARPFAAMITALAVGSIFAGAPAVRGADTEHPRVIFETSHGSFVLELDREATPETVANFLAYVRGGYYAGTIFHRVIPGFMIQGGGFTQELQQRPTRAPVRNEADRGGKNERGSIAMARTSDPHSATAQFFINVADNDFLNHTAPTSQGWGYTVFGRVVEGMDVVDRIAALKTGAGGLFRKDLPQETVAIQEARIDKGE